MLRLQACSYQFHAYTVDMEWKKWPVLNTEQIFRVWVDHTKLKL